MTEFSTSKLKKLACECNSKTNSRLCLLFWKLRITFSASWLLKEWLSTKKYLKRNSILMCCKKQVSLKVTSCRTRVKLHTFKKVGDSTGQSWWCPCLVLDPSRSISNPFYSLPTTTARNRLFTSLSSFITSPCSSYPPSSGYSSGATTSTLHHNTCPTRKQARPLGLSPTTSASSTLSGTILTSSCLLAGLPSTSRVGNVNKTFSSMCGQLKSEIKRSQSLQRKVKNMPLTLLRRSPVRKHWQCHPF